MTDYSKMDDMDISKAVLSALGYKLIDDNMSCAVYMSDKERRDIGVGASKKFNFDPCNNPADAWPIIVESGIGIAPSKKNPYAWDISGGLLQGIKHSDSNPLRAAMIVFLMMKEKKE